MRVDSSYSANMRYHQGIDKWMRTVNSHDSNKKLSLEFPEGYQIWEKAPKCRRVQWPKHCGYCYQDEFNSLQWEENNNKYLFFNIIFFVNALNSVTDINEIG